MRVMQTEQYTGMVAGGENHGIDLDSELNPSGREFMPQNDFRTLRMISHRVGLAKYRDPHRDVWFPDFVDGFEDPR